MLAPLASRQRHAVLLRHMLSAFDYTGPCDDMPRFSASYYLRHTSRHSATPCHVIIIIILHFACRRYYALLLAYAIINTPLRNIRHYAATAILLAAAYATRHAITLPRCHSTLPPLLLLQRYRHASLLSLFLHDATPLRRHYEPPIIARQ